MLVILGRRDCGLLREGFAADVVVFDVKTVRDTNSFERPKSYTSGVPDVLVKCSFATDKGRHAGTRPGKPLRGPGYKPGRAATSGQ